MLARETLSQKLAASSRWQLEIDSLGCAYRATMRIIAIVAPIAMFFVFTFC